MSTRSGQCLCGAIRFEARNVPQQALVCHCPMCQRWTGSAYVEVNVAEADVTWQGAEHIRTHRASGWGERAFCGTCGSHIFFRVTEEGEYAGTYALPLGLFDDRSGFELAAEIYIDTKPDAYAFADHGQRLITRAECIEKFPRLADQA